MLLRKIIIVICSSYSMHGSHLQTRTDHYFDDLFNYQDSRNFRAQRSQPSALSELEEQANSQRTRIDIPDTPVNLTLPDQPGLGYTNHTEEPTAPIAIDIATAETQRTSTQYKKNFCTYPDKKIFCTIVSLVCMGTTIIMKLLTPLTNS
jgi:hypothetical protein